MTRVAVVGLGLIGGSLGLALRARGYDRSPEARAQARARGLDAAESLAEAVSGAEIAVAAVPTSEAPALLAEIAAAAPSAILTDIASLKRPLADSARTLPQGARFVGGHPMAGSEAAGIGAARPDLFQGRLWALVPTARSDETAMAACQSLARAVGARPIVLDADRHDRLMTWVSHLPLSVAAALSRAASLAGGPDLPEFAGPGYLDTTRVAAQPIELALELALADPDALAGAVESVSSELAALCDALRRKDADALRRFFEEASAARRRT
jgi:prephenate dehydrogenase